MIKLGNSAPPISLYMPIIDIQKEQGKDLFNQYLGQDFLNAAVPLVETQILYGGLRLAALLNSLF